MLYHVFSELSEIGEQNVIAVDIVLGVVSFFVVVIGSIGIGVLLGLAGSFSARFTHHMRVMEPMIVVVIPYLAFIVAEMFHLSGILSYVYCVALLSVCRSAKFGEDISNHGRAIRPLSDTVPL